MGEILILLADRRRHIDKAEAVVDDDIDPARLVAAATKLDPMNPARQ